MQGRERYNMEIYFIIAVSFAIMYTISYGIEITRTINLAIDTFGLDYKNSNWNPINFNIALFLISLVTMPILMLGMFTEDKWTTIQRATTNILEGQFNFVKKK